MPDWVPSLIVTLAGAAACMLWSVTGVSPLVWTAWVCLHLESVRAQVLESIAAAFAHFRKSYPKTRRDATGQIAVLMLSRDRGYRHTTSEDGVEIEEVRS